MATLTFFSSVERAAKFFLLRHFPRQVRYLDQLWARVGQDDLGPRLRNETLTLAAALVEQPDTDDAERVRRLGPKRLTKTPVVEINNTCNIDCLMCKTSLSTRKKGKIGEEMLERLLDEYSKHDIIGVELHTIGDPLANPSLPAVLSSLRRRRLTTALTTNGLLLYRHVDTILAHTDVVRGITFSIDGGTPETYEHVRSGGKWSDLIDNLEIAVSRIKPFIPLRVACTVSTDNINELGLVIERFRHVVTDLVTGFEFHPVSSLSPDTSYFEMVNLLPTLTRKNSNCNFINGESLFAHIDGRVSVCCRDYDGSLVIGDLKSSTVEKIWQDAPLRKLQQAHDTGDLRDFPLCYNCNVVDIRASRMFTNFMKYLVLKRPTATAEEYQGFVAAFIYLMQTSKPVTSRVTALMDEVSRK